MRTYAHGLPRLCLWRTAGASVGLSATAGTWVPKTWVRAVSGFSVTRSVWVVC